MTRMFLATVAALATGGVSLPALAGPDLKVGDEFHYKRVSGLPFHEVYRGSDAAGNHRFDRYNGRAARPVEYLFTPFMSSKGNRIFQYSPHLGYLTPDPKVGKRWRTSVREYITTSKRRSGPYTRRCVINAREKITVAAGAFEAWKITCTAKWESGLNRITWWADVKTLKAVRFRRTYGGHTSGFDLAKVKRSPR